MDSDIDRFILRCIKCKSSYKPLADRYICNCGSNLMVEYDLASIKKYLRKDDLMRRLDMTIWRYLSLLPVNKRLLCPPVGWTPLIDAPLLAKTIGVKRVFVKDDGRNPSASFKDRASAVAIQRAIEIGKDLVVAASTGNAACATAVLSAQAGIRTRIFVPKNAPKAKIAQLLTFGAEVLAVDGTYDQAFELSLQATRRFGWYNRNTGFNPYTREGKKTVSFEICEQMGFQVPDLVVVPVGDGNIISGVWKGFLEFYKLGFIDRLPRLLGVQAKHSAAVVNAFLGDGVIRPVSGETIADSISVSIPRDGDAAVLALKESNGFGVIVEDDEILDAIGEVARKAGVFGEPAGVASWAGLKVLAKKGLVDPEWTVVILVTGSGLKDIGSAMKKAGDFRVIQADVSVLDTLQ